MTYPDNNLTELHTRLSRGKFLRNAALSATGIGLLPSIISSCKKIDANTERQIPNWGAEIKSEDLAAAAENLKRLRVWIKDLYPLSIEYEDVVFQALNSTKENGNWTNFIVDIFIDVAAGLAVAAAVATGGAAAVPAIACMSAFLHDWGIGKDRPSELAAFFGAFEDGHNKMQLALEQKLSALVEPTNNYSNLYDAWKDGITFNGKNYTIGDLASSNFPDLGDLYNQLQTAAYTNFKKSLWNLAILKCCTYYENYHQDINTPQTPAAQFILYAQKTFYPQNKGVYVRGDLASYNDDGTIDWDLIYYNLGINGYPFSDQAAAILFMDDSPGHIINPDGLFNRSYVFQQFSPTKPVFKAHELGDTVSGNNFANTDDWDYTGGFFPQLIKI